MATTIQEIRYERGEAMASRVRVYISCCGLAGTLDARYDEAANMLRLGAPGFKRSTDDDLLYPVGYEWEAAAKAHIQGYAGILAA